jgi:hypothetical protein
MGIGISPTVNTSIRPTKLSAPGHKYEEQRIEKLIDLIPASAYQDGSWKGAQVKAACQAVGLAVSPDGLHAVVGIWAAVMPGCGPAEQDAGELRFLDGRV